MKRFLLTWVVTALSLIITAFVVPGISLTSWVAAAVAAIVLGLVNATVRPVILILTLPLTILTLGLFLLVVNAISIALVAYLTPGFTVGGFFPAVFGSIVLSFVSGLLNQWTMPEENETV